MNSAAASLPSDSGSSASDSSATRFSTGSANSFPMTAAVCRRCFSPLSLFRDLLRANRGADLEEQTVRLAELALAGGVVAVQSCQLGALDAEEGLIALRARHLEPGTRGAASARRPASLHLVKQVIQQWPV